MTMVNSGLKGLTGSLSYPRRCVCTNQTAVYVAENGVASYGSFDPTVDRKSEVLGSNPGRVGYLSSRLCIYSAPSCLKAWSVQWCL